MRKRLLLMISILVLKAWSTDACNSQLKAVKREVNGTTTRTPFLVNATFTSVSPPLEGGEGDGNGIPSPTVVIEPSTPEETSQTESNLTASPTPSSTPTPKENTLDPTEPSNSPNPTATSKPTNPPSTAKPTNTPADTSPPVPPADTNTPKPTTPPPTPTPDVSVSSGNSGFESDGIVLINQERADRGLPALIQNASLTQAARRHNLDMA